MATISRHSIMWTGFIGAPGISHFYSNASDDPAMHTALATWKTSLAPSLPDDVTLTLQANVDQLDDTTGDLVGSFTIGSDLTTTGANTGGYSAASGFCVNWLTAGVVAGRRVRGRTFVVPLSGGAYDTNGTIDSLALLNFRTNVATLQLAIQGIQVVWSRPRDGLAGSSHEVTSANVPDKVAILRSRRD